MTDDIRFYISVFWRRFHYFALIAIAISAAGIAIALILPTKWTAEATLLIESPQIPDELATVTVRTNPQEQLEIIEQRLLTRQNLLDIADDTDVFPQRAGMFADEVVEQMRNATTFEISTGRDRASLFTISFEAEQSITAAEVVSAYVTKVLEDNARLRKGIAEGTQEFFQAERDRLAEDLTRKSAEILAFKNANIDSLPENMEFQLDRQADLRDRLADIGREIASLGQQRERLIVVFNATGGDGGRDLRSPAQRELDTARDELTTALTIYSESNPKVRQLRARIAALEASLGNVVDPADGEAERAGSLLDLQLQEIDTRIDALETEKLRLEDELDELRVSLEEMPSNSVALDELQRDYDNLQLQYNAAVESLSAASTGERIELLSKGERISVIDQPVAPREPSSPPRVLIAVGSVFFGIMAGLGVIVLMELLNRSIRRPADLVRQLGVTPIATIPMMRTPGEVARRRTIVLSSILAATIGIVGAVYYLHTEVMPLDLIADRAIDSIGL